MNGPLETFHAAYRQGQWFDWGEQPRLMNLLEGLGGGLPTDEPWRQGGPLLVNFGARQVLAWMRGIPPDEAGRANAWEAWGIVGLAASFIKWPSFWNDLHAGPDRVALDRIAMAMSSGRPGSDVPPIPASLTETLENLYLADEPPPIMMYAPDDLPLLAWAYVLGPAERTSATVAPPRRHRLISREPFTYQGEIAERAPENKATRWSSPLISQIVNSVRSGDHKTATRIVNELRVLSPAERKRRVTAIAHQPEPRRHEVNVQQDQMNRERKTNSVHDATPATGMADAIRNIDIRTIVLATVVAVLIVLSVGNTYYLWRIANAVEKLVPQATTGAETQNPGKATTDTFATTTQAPAATATVPAAEAEVACEAAWWTRAEDRTRVLDALRRKLPANNVQPVRGAARELEIGTNWNDINSPTILANMYLQIQLKVAGCYAGAIDGDAGRSTNNAMAACVGRIPLATRDQKLQSLCVWAQR